MLIVQVALPVPILHQFNYQLPNNFRPVIGGRVLVPFGNRNMIGVVIGFSEQNSLPDIQLKSVLKEIDNKSLYPSALWRILNWSSDYYHYPLGEILFHALPSPLRKGKSVKSALFHWFITKKGLKTIPESLKRTPKQQKALEMLCKNPLSQYEITQYKLSNKVLQALQEKGLCILREYLTKQRNWRNSFKINDTQVKLNTEQEIAASTIRSQDTRFITWLLSGITGSGKTEVYLNVLENVLNNGLQALVLVPEISLIPQTISRFRAHFNAPIDVLHSGLNNRERMDVWIRARQGENAIVVGTRSALFTPFSRLGMIILDEEHDNSYKQQSGWRYHARDLAVFRAREENIPIVLGSATPALETLHNAKSGKYCQLTLRNRARNTYKVIKQLIDLRGLQLYGGLSSALIYRIRLHLQEDNQVLLFLNRRGFSPSFLCHDCGWVAECQRCDHYYTLHKKQQKLRCHYCDSQYPVLRRCPKCSSLNLIPVGLGTEQIEYNLKTLFPNIPLSRIDRDTTSHKGSLEKHLANVLRGGARILIGTQMLTKGHHFPNVTLVSIIDVDSALFSTDFRAAERFAQLYIQVEGRAGRTNKQGEVLLQTHHPDHPLLQTLLCQGYDAFANQALLERKKIRLPPFTNHAIFRAEDQDNQQAFAFLQQLRDLLEANPFRDKSFWIMGPIPALQAKRSGRYRWQLLLQHSIRLQLQKRLKINFPIISTLSLSRKVKWSLDIDPTES